MRDTPPAKAEAPVAAARQGAQFVRFCVAGTIGFLVDVAVLYVAAPVLGWYAGRVVSFLAAVATTWVVNRQLAFRAQARRGSRSGIAQEFGRYLVSMLGGAAINYLAYVVTLHFYSGPLAAALGVAMGSVAGLSVNFLSARFFVFRP